MSERADPTRDWLAVHLPEVAAWMFIVLAALVLVGVGAWVARWWVLRCYDRYLLAVSGAYVEMRRIPAQREPSR